MKPSEIFEGDNSSLKKTFDEATQQPEKVAHPEPSREWEEELRRQCEIRQLPFSEVKYLVDEVVLSERTALVEEITEAIKNLTVEEAPPFSANDEIRDKAKIINEYLLPAVKERLLSTINFITETK